MRKQLGDDVLFLKLQIYTNNILKSERLSEILHQNSVVIWWKFKCDIVAGIPVSKQLFRIKITRDLMWLTVDSVRLKAVSQSAVLLALWS